MPRSARSLRISVAAFVALAMVGGAYATSGTDPLFGPNVAGAQTAEELLEEYAGKDTDTDGLPDWQEALYGTSPTEAESFRDGISDGDAVAQGLIEPRVIVREEEAPTDPDTIPGTAAAPNTLTDRFAQTLLQQYLQGRGENTPSQEQIAGFVEASVSELAEGASTQNAFSVRDLNTSAGSGRETLLSYVVTMERALAANNIRAQKNELFLFADAIRGQTEALDGITAAGEAYEASARAVIEVPVPLEAQRAHLAIANALMQMASASESMAALNDDPLRALMGIGLYEPASEASVVAFAEMHAVMSAYSITLPLEAEGGEFLYVCSAAAGARTQSL